MNYVIIMCESSGTESDEEVNPSEFCCVCGLWKPKKRQNIYVLVIPKWAQCDGMRDGMPCKQWVHFPYCRNVKVVRRHSQFYCPHCVPKDPMTRNICALSK